jgi:hypothetical protein
MEVVDHPLWLQEQPFTFHAFLQVIQGSFQWPEHRLHCYSGERTITSNTIHNHHTTRMIHQPSRKQPIKSKTGIKFLAVWFFTNPQHDAPVKQLQLIVTEWTI